VEGTEAELRSALSVFQRANNLTSNGELDSSTVTKLVELFGC
jgi:hypothetical protein